MPLYERNVQRKKTSCFFQLRAEKIAFPYFYISAFCSLTDGHNIYILDARIREKCAKKKIRTLSQLGADKIAFPPNLTDGWMDGHK